MLCPGLQGCDEKFFNASLQSANVDLLLDFINAEKSSLSISMESTTLVEYFCALHATKLTWHICEHQDFLPYSSGMSLCRLGFRSGAGEDAHRVSALPC